MTNSLTDSCNPANRQSVRGKAGEAWRRKAFSRCFSSLRKTLTRARLDTGCKPTGFLSAHQLGLISFSQTSLALISPYLAFDLTLIRFDIALFRFVYLLLIYLGRRWMASRPPFNLRTSLAAWSFALALFSILGFLRNSFLNLLVVEIMVFN